MIDDAVHAAKREQLLALSSECQLSLDELDSAVQPIIESCTKEAISVCAVDQFPNLCIMRMCFVYDVSMDVITLSQTL